MRSKTTEEQRRIFKFVIAGAIRTGIGYGLYLLVYWSGLPLGLALATDYVFAIATGYILNRGWVFSHHGPSRATLLRYGIAYVVAFVIEWLVLQLAMTMGIEPEIGRIPSLVLATAVSYLMQRYWVFKGP